MQSDVRRFQHEIFHPRQCDPCGRIHCLEAADLQRYGAGLIARPLTAGLRKRFDNLLGPRDWTSVLWREWAGRRTVPPERTARGEPT